MTDRTHREFSRADINKIANTYHAYTGTSGKRYKDIVGFCKAATLDDIAKNDYVLTPGRYVGIVRENVQSTEDFESEMMRLHSEITKEFKQSNRLQKEIIQILKGVSNGN